MKSGQRAGAVVSAALTLLLVTGCAGKPEGASVFDTEVSTAVAADDGLGGPTVTEDVEDFAQDIVVGPAPTTPASSSPPVSIPPTVFTPAAVPTVTVTESPSAPTILDSDGNTVVSRPPAPPVPVGRAGAGEVVQISEIDGNLSAECGGGRIEVSGIDNRVLITGHCAELVVSGIDNIIVIDQFDALDLSGVRNHITFHQGEYVGEPGGIDCVVVKG